MHDAVFTRTFALPSGRRVRLRLAGLRDRPAVEALLRERGVAAGDLDLHRLVCANPAERLVLAAFALVDGAERLVGVGAIDLAADADLDTLVVDERLAGGLGLLLGDVLRRRAAAHARRVA
ncbi:MAG: hypothetical protein QOE86_37 [Solirubrobacteraceae bacterium]|jgi:hypothetical protein|nr:hypothetical protein [Solirubrobacteraceae bacterium]